MECFDHPRSKNNPECGLNQETGTVSGRKKGLTDYSPKDKPWNRHRSHTDDIRGIYARADEFERYGQRLDTCSGELVFTWSVNPKTGELQLKLKRAFFCRVRYCPVCQWRRSLMWQARFYQALPRILADYPKSRWLFLTLTVRNCEIDELSQTLKSMNVAWNKFIKRRDLKPIQGWIRTTEVTRGQDRSAHPHFHALLMVPGYWFTGKYYVKHTRWVELWKESLRVNYEPNIDIRTVKPKKGTEQITADFLKGAVSETLKYSTKVEDITGDAQWFLELTRQTHKKRFLASGGALKDILKPEDETNQDLVKGDSSETDLEEESGVELSFDWNTLDREYQRYVF